MPETYAAARPPTSSVRHQLLKVWEAPSLIPCALAHTLTCGTGCGVAV